VCSQNIQYKKCSKSVLPFGQSFNVVYLVQYHPFYRILNLIYLVQKSPCMFTARFTESSQVLHSKTSESTRSHFCAYCPLLLIHPMRKIRQSIKIWVAFAILSQTFFRFITTLTVKLHYKYKYQCRCEIFTQLSRPKFCVLHKRNINTAKICNACVTRHAISRFFNT
jgi:hypothetical protein